MKNVLRTWFPVLLACLVAGSSRAAGMADPRPGPARVEVRQIDGCWQILINHQRFYIKGAGLERGDQEKLAEHGGNSFRTWRTENGSETGQQVLDRAWRNGLYVTMGLDIAR